MFPTAAILLLSLVQADASPVQTTEASALTPASAEPVIADVPLPEYRVELLDFASRIASSLPEFPHIKDRSLEQELVVEACLALEQPVRALEVAEGILNWRRGAGYADYAHYCAERGAVEEAERFLAKATEIAQWPEEEIRQAWRRDRVRAKIARTYVALGRKEDAARFTIGLVDSEWGAVEEVLGAQLPVDEFELWFRNAREVFDNGSFDQISNALNGMAQMHGRFYADAERRAEIEEAMAGGWLKVPVEIRFKVALVLGKNAVAHGDVEHAREIADETEKVLLEATLDARTRIKLAVSLGELRHVAGQEKLARAQIDSALATYQESREMIVDIFRADILVPVAEAYDTLGVPESAVALYELAVTEGIVNPNSRPRAEDLGLVCRSMAVRGVEPSDAIREILHDVTPTLGHEYKDL